MIGCILTEWRIISVTRKNKFIWVTPFLNWHVVSSEWQKKSAKTFQWHFFNEIFGNFTTFEEWHFVFYKSVWNSYFFFVTQTKEALYFRVTEMTGHSVACNPHEVSATLQDQETCLLILRQDSEKRQNQPLQRKCWTRRTFLRKLHWSI